MRKRTGTSLLLLGAIFVLPLLANKKKVAPERYVVLYGTVFRDTGFALPDADVAVIPDASDTSGPKVKKMQAVSNGRGEFAFHLPAVNKHYVVKVSAKGFRSEEKSVAVNGEDRIDVTFQLQQESK